jgi:predicted transcriptional regulator of viral defense system
MPIVHRDKIYELAEARHGYFTVAEAKAAGVTALTLTKMAARGVLERTSHGVYRLAHFPVFPEGQYIEAALWPQGATGVISHQSALALHGLSDVSPSKVHITVPPTHRVRRGIPRYLVIHHAPLGPHEVEVLDGIPATTPARTIRDCHAADLGLGIIRQAISDGRTSGKLTKREADTLFYTLLGDTEVNREP